MDQLNQLKIFDGILVLRQFPKRCFPEQRFPKQCFPEQHFPERRFHERHFPENKG
jgi:hypothetical protein